MSAGRKILGWLSELNPCTYAQIQQMENLLTFCVVRACVCVHTDVDKDVFLFDSRSFGFAQVGVTFACDLILRGEMHHSRAGTCFSTFLAQMTPHSQKRNILILSLSPLSPCLSLLPSVTHRQHVHTDCLSSLNDSVNVPHQRMTHSTTLLLWWFLPSVYYIMQQRVLLSYIHHNKHSLSALASAVQGLVPQPCMENII